MAALGKLGSKSRAVLSRRPFDFFGSIGLDHLLDNISNDHDEVDHGPMSVVLLFLDEVRCKTSGKLTQILLAFPRFWMVFQYAACRAIPTFL